VFAFSSENWKRPTEGSRPDGLVLVAVAKYLGKLADKGVAHPHRRDRNQVSDKTAPGLEQAESKHRTQTPASRCRGVQLRRSLGTSCRPAGKRSAPAFRPPKLDEAR